MEGDKAMETKDIQNLEYYAYVSAVTGGDNVNRMKEKLVAQGKTGFIVAMEIASFKAVNAICGVKRGEDILRKTWECLCKCLGEGDLAGHVYSDEFILFLEGDDEAVVADKLAGITEALAEMSQDMDIPLIMPCFGIAPWKPSDSVEQSHGNAMMARGKIKNRFEVNYAFYSDADSERMLKDMLFEETFESAIDNGEFEIWYQPKCNPDDGGLIGAEALVRWNRNGDLIPPDAFVHIFERNGMIRRLDEYVFRKVCQQQKRWELEGRKIVPVSTNLSRVSLYFPNIVTRYKNIVKEVGIAYKYVPLEITESAAIDNADLKKLTDEFFKAGFGLHLDDFGTGYSSLSTLNQLHFNTLKLDKSLIDYIGNYGGDKLLEHTVALAKDLGLHVTAEGVENEAQVKFLSELNCDSIQGYYYSKPLCCNDFERVLADEKLLYYGETSNQHLDLSSINSHMFKNVMKETIDQAVEYAKSNNKTLVANPFITQETIYVHKEHFVKMMGSFFQFAIDQVPERECVVFTCFRRAVADANYVSYNFMLLGVNTTYNETELDRILEDSEKFRRAKDMAEELGGSVVGGCSENKNLQIKIRIPFKQVKQASHPFADLQKVYKREMTGNLKGKRLLLAEDEELSRFLTTEMLNSAGFEVEAVADGGSVIDALCAHEPGYYAFVLMDIVMPTMNGYVTTKSIREIDRPDLKKIPIIALSAHTMDEDRNNSLECGMNGHVSKPLDLQELSKVLAECIPL